MLDSGGEEIATKKAEEDSAWRGLKKKKEGVKEVEVLRLGAQTRRTSDRALRKVSDKS